MKTFLMAVIRFYQRRVSPALPVSCRYAPSCSEYALTSIDRFGALAGLLLAAGRLARCHPFHPGGYDPVPRGPLEMEIRRSQTCGGQERGKGETKIQTAV